MVEMVDQEDIYSTYKGQLDTLAALSPCRYAIERYGRGHRQLVVSVVSIGDEKQSKPRYAVFTGVDYLNLIPRWERSSFSIVPLAETRDVLAQLGIDFGEGRLPYVVYTQLSGLRLHIVCHIIQVIDKMPEDYSYRPD